MGLVLLCVCGIGLKSQPCDPADWRVVVVRQEQLPPVPIRKHDCRKRDWRQRHPHWPLRLHGIQVWSCLSSTELGRKIPRKIAFKNAWILKKVLIALLIADKCGRRITKYALFYTENERLFAVWAVETSEWVQSISSRPNRRELTVPLYRPAAARSRSQSCLYVSRRE